MKDYPIIKIALFFAAGIIIQKYSELSFYVLAVAALVLLILIFLSLRFDKSTNYASVLTFILSIALGAAVFFQYNLMTEEQKYKFNRIKNVTLYGEFHGIELYRQGEIKAAVISDSLCINGKIIKKNLRVISNLRNEDCAGLQRLYQTLKIGDKVEIKGNLLKGRARRNPGDFDYDKFLTNSGFDGLIYSYNLTDWEIYASAGWGFKNEIFKIRKTIAEKIESFHDKKSAGLLKGLLLADRRDIDNETKEEFINAGVVHVLAVSGLHVGFIALIFYVLFGRFGLIYRSILTILGLFCFLLITGASPSVFRAVVMATVYLIGGLTNRRSSAYNSLAVAAVIILLINPNELFGASFLLSFSAVLAIVSLYPFFKKRIEILKTSKTAKNILLFSCISLSAQIGTLPFTIIYFGKVSIAALFINLIVIPLIGIIVANGIFTIAVSFIFTYLASIYASANNFLSQTLFWLVKTAGRFEYSYFSIKDFSSLDAFFLFTFIIFFFWFYKRLTFIKAKLLFTILIVANIVIFVSLDDFEYMPDGALTVMVSDVGQGDAIFIKFPNGTSWLIDAGEANIFIDNGKRTLIPLFSYLGVRKIDLGIITHFDSDHYGGFYSLIDAGLIKKMNISRIDTSIAKEKRFFKFLNDKKVEFEYFDKTSFYIGGVKSYFLNDADDYEEQGFDSNDKSGVIKIVYGETSFLFTGDAGHNAEELLISRYNNFLKSDALKISHHGSASGSSDKFLNIVNPKYAVISAGLYNKFGHPDKGVLQNLKELGIKTLRTDLQGAVILFSDGEIIEELEWNN